MDSFAPRTKARRSSATTPVEPITREQRRSRRKRAIRARTVSIKRMTKSEIWLGRMMYPEDTTALRPKTRAECVGAPRPCPFVSCKYHLYLDVQPRTGAIKLNFPDLEVEEMKVSCALDVADRGGVTLEEAGAIMNLTRERIRQIEVRAMAKLEASREVGTLRTFVDEGPVGKRHLPVLNKYEVDDENLPGFEEPDDDNEDDDDDDRDGVDWGPHGPIDPLDRGPTRSELERLDALADQFLGVTNRAVRGAK